MKNKAFIIVSLLIVAIMLSACKATFPSKEEIIAMTGEEATNLLKDKTAKDIHDNWGEPHSFFSGLYGDIYVYDNKCIGVYYDGAFGSTGGRVFRVVMWDKDKE